MDKTMTIQQAAARILEEYKKPLKSKEIARMAQERGFVLQSTAKDPIQSLSQALERNIRLNKGNKPRLVFTETDQGRCIAIPEWYEKIEIEPKLGEKLEIHLTGDLINKVELYQNSFNLHSFEEAIISLVKKGLNATSDELIDRLKAQLDAL